MWGVPVSGSHTSPKRYLAAPQRLQRHGQPGQFPKRRVAAPADIVPAPVHAGGRDRGVSLGARPSAVAVHPADATIRGA
jgi:hypothetical protein